MNNSNSNNNNNYKIFIFYEFYLLFVKIKYLSMNKILTFSLNKNIKKFNLISQKNILYIKSIHCFSFKQTFKI